MFNRHLLQTVDITMTTRSLTWRNLFPRSNDRFRPIVPDRTLQAFRHREGKEEDGARTAGGASAVLRFEPLPFDETQRETRNRTLAILSGVDDAKASRQRSQRIPTTAVRQQVSFESAFASLLSAATSLRTTAH